jgi:hypothetical protein
MGASSSAQLQCLSPVANVEVCLLSTIQYCPGDYSYTLDQWHYFNSLSAHESPRVVPKRGFYYLEKKNVPFRHLMQLLAGCHDQIEEAECLPLDGCVWKADKGGCLPEDACNKVKEEEQCIEEVGVL